MPSTRYPRRGEGLDFDRVMFFTDAVFAIAMTLLVVEIGVPETIAGDAADPAALFAAFNDKGPLIFAFFLGCYVIGSYWVAHHRFMSWLGAVDRGFVVLTVVYLTFVALLPFPTGVIGEFGENPVSVAAFAEHGGGAVRPRPAPGLLRQEWPEDVYRWELRASLSPVVFFALSVPVAFVEPRLAVLMWFLAIPLGMLLGRRRPPSAARYIA